MAVWAMLRVVVVDHGPGLTALWFAATVDGTGVRGLSAVDRSPLRRAFVGAVRSRRASFAGWNRGAPRSDRVAVAGCVGGRRGLAFAASHGTTRGRARSASSAVASTGRCGSRPRVGAAGGAASGMADAPGLARARAGARRGGASAERRGTLARDGGFVSRPTGGARAPRRARGSVVDHGSNARCRVTRAAGTRGGRCRRRDGGSWVSAPQRRMASRCRPLVSTACSTLQMMVRTSR